MTTFQNVFPYIGKCVLVNMLFLNHLDLNATLPDCNRTC